MGPIDLDGKTTFELTNIQGTNAVNLILAIPVDKWERVQQDSGNFLENRTVLYNLDPNRFEWDGRDDTSRSSFSVLKEYGQYNVSILGDGDQTILLDQATPLSINKTGERVTLTKGEALVIFNDSLTTVFEEQFENLQWLFSPGVSSVGSPTLDFWGRLDVTEKTNGNYSLNLTTSTSQEGYWSNVVGGPIAVTKGEQCLISIQMKWNNTKQSHVAIDGIRENGQVYRLAELMHGKDGSENWTSFSNLVQIPQDTTNIRVVLNAGWVNDTREGRATTWFDNLTVQKMVDKNVTLILSDGPLVVDGGLSNTEESASSNGYANTYVLSFSGSGWTLREVPEVYYGTALNTQTAGVKLTTIPIYFTTTGLLVSSQGGNSTLVLEDRAKVDFNGLGLLAFGVIFGIAAIIIISLVFEREEKKYKLKRGSFRCKPPRG